MNWTSPSKSLRAVCERGTTYVICPAGMNGHVLRAIYPDMFSEMLYAGDIETCKRAAAVHLKAARQLDSTIRNLSTVAMQGDEDER